MTVDSPATRSVVALAKEIPWTVDTKASGDTVTLIIQGPQGESQWQLRSARSARTFLAAQPAPHGEEATVFPLVSPSEARRLKEGGHQFLDEAGNAHLSAGSLYVSITGNTRTAAPAKKGHKAFGEAGLKVTLALLTRPDLACIPYRTLGKIVGVTHGAANNAVRDLERLGYVETRDERRMVVRARRRELLAEWASAFERTLRGKLSLGRYRLSNSELLPQASLDAARFAWSGDVAAALVDGALRPHVYTLYTSATPGEIARTLRAVPDDEGPLEVLQLFWKPEALSPEAAPSSPLAPLPLIYADLMGQGDARSLEAAWAIRDKLMSA